MVAIAQKLVVIAAVIAGLLGATASALPGTIPKSVPPACVKLPLVVQAGYCP